MGRQLSAYDRDIGYICWWARKERDRLSQRCQGRIPKGRGLKVGLTGLKESLNFSGCPFPKEIEASFTEIWMK